MRSIQRVFLLVLFFNIFVSADDQALKLEVLRELNLKTVPEAPSKEKINEAVNKKVRAKFTSEMKNDIIAKFTNEYPVIKLGDQINFKAEAYSLSGKLNGILNNAVVIDSNKHAFIDLPHDLKMRFDASPRQNELKKLLKEKFYDPGYKYRDQVAEEIRQSTPYFQFHTLLKEKKEKAYTAKFDVIHDRIKKSYEKADFIELLTYYKDNTGNLTSRKVTAERLEKEYSFYDASLLMKGLKTALTAKDSFAESKLSNDKIVRSIVLIEGDHGVGTGFLTNYYGLKCIISNQHVFIGNKSVKITDIDNNQISFKGMLMGKPSENVGATDIVIYGLDEATKKKYDFISVSNKMSMNARTEVYGNSLGDRVIRSISGILKGIGPRTIEVSNRFVSGNSGSPIIQDGYAIGIATFIKATPKTWNQRSSDSGDIRWFGVKISAMDLNDYEIFDPGAYDLDIQVLGELRKTISEFRQEYEQAAKNRTPMKTFVEENKASIEKIKTFLPKVKAHTFMSQMESYAKEVLFPAEAILEFSKSVKNSDQDVAGVPERPERPEAGKTNMSKMFDYSKKLRETTEDKFMTSIKVLDNKNGTSLSVRVTNFTDKTIKSLSVIFGAFNEKTHEAILLDNEVALNLKGRKIYPRRSFTFEVKINEKLPADDIKFYGGVININ